jgi:D-alanine-D-alanine ligase
MSDLGRVVLLAGGLSHERDVSLRSGRRVAEALRQVGVDVEVRDVDSTLVPAMMAEPPTAVLPLIHGAQGEDGALQGVLGLLGLPYVGSRPAPCRVAFDKPVAKTFVGGAGIATPEAVVLPHATFRDLGAAGLMEALVGRLGLPLVVKPARGGSALGCSVVHAVQQLPSALVSCFAYGEDALVERRVAGREVAVSVIDTGEGPYALPGVEIVADGGMYDYQARYTAGATEFFVPARLTAAERAAAAEAALRAHEVLGLRDLSRTDMIVDAEGRPWFLDMNVTPGMTETSLLPQSVAAAGLDLGELVRDLLAQAVQRDAQRS